MSESNLDWVDYVVIVGYFLGVLGVGLAVSNGCKKVIYNILNLFQNKILSFLLHINNRY